MIGFYRALLRLYPRSYRAEYQAELCRAFAERVREIGGPLRPLAIAWAALADVVPNAIAVHAEILGQDLGYAARSLSHAPGFALTAVLVVALGVGANTTVFSIADLVFVRPLPFPDAGRLVKIWESSHDYGTNEPSPANYRDWRQMSTSFAGMAAYCRQSANLVGTGEPRLLEAIAATPDLLPLMGVRPEIGRTFTAEDAASGSCIVLSHALWRSQFGGDPKVLGTTVRLDGTPYTVVGVMPASFQFPDRSIEAWSSLVFRDGAFDDRNDNYLGVVARLRPGVSVEQAKREMALVSARLERQYPKENHDVRAAVFRLRDELSGNARLLVLALCGAALCILLLACANLASLLLARGTHRAHELAVRTALGAGHERLVRQLLTESLAIATIGGIVGIGVAVLGVPLLTRLVPASLPIAGTAALDLRLLGLAIAFIVITGIGFGLAPALRLAHSGAAHELRAGSRSTGASTQRLRAGLVVVEVAASVVLLVTSGLLIRAVWRIQATDTGFVPEHVLTLRTVLPLPKYDLTARRAAYYGRVLDEVRALPGVRSAAYVTGLPMAMTGGIWPVTIPGQEMVRDQDHSASLRFVTPQFFATLGIPLKRGRDVADADRRERPDVAVVSESFARRLWPNEDPLGKRFNVATEDRTVVGVVADVRVRGREQTSEPQMYLPHRQVRDSSLVGYIPKVLVIRTEPSLRAGALVPKVRHIVRAADPEQPISDVRMLSEVVADETASRVTQVRLLGALAAVALMIAGLGIHGLLSFAVSMRVKELGLRMALGAQAREIVGLVLREGIVLGAAGIAIGGLVAWAASRGMGALLFDVRPEDPLTLGATVALCLATILVGCLRPAWRASRTDPWVALRSE